MKKPQRLLGSAVFFYLENLETATSKCAYYSHAKEASTRA